MGQSLRYESGGAGSGSTDLSTRHFVFYGLTSGTSATGFVEETVPQYSQILKYLVLCLGVAASA